MSQKCPSDFEAPVWSGDVKDVTTYCEFNKALPPETTSLLNQQTDCFSIEDALTVKQGASRMSGRGLACRCFKSTYWSVTLRVKAPANQAEPYMPVGRDTEGVTNHENNLEQDHPFYRKWFNNDTLQSGYLYTLNDVCKTLYPLLFPEGGQAAGIVVITGVTSTGKSEIARGLIWLYLRYLCENTRNVKQSNPEASPRRPHLITVEKPIEKFLYEDKDGNPEPPGVTQVLSGMDYTPRQLDTDTPSLYDALMKDALRQTPATVYVGETRSEEDWKNVIEFAGTGHLVVTTAHANSVVETMEKMITAVGAKTPAERGQAAQRIHAIVHLKSLFGPQDQDGISKSGVVPAMWKGTAAGIAALVADGMASILPTRTPLATVHEGIYSVGRTSFFHQLLSSKNLFKPELLLPALESDLRGI